VTELHPTRPDRLDLGEGIRWTGEHLVLVDILSGRLLVAPDVPTAPLRTVATLPVPLGAVAPARVGLDPVGPYDGGLFSVRVDVPGAPAAPYRPAPSLLAGLPSYGADVAARRSV
jgi:hypothetical protein